MQINRRRNIIEAILSKWMLKSTVGQFVVNATTSGCVFNANNYRCSLNEYVNFYFLLRKPIQIVAICRIKFVYLVAEKSVDFFFACYST